MSSVTRWCDRLLEAGTLLSIPAGVLFFSTQSARGFEPDKIYLLHALASVLGATMLVRMGSTRPRPGRPGPVTLTLLIVGLANLVSTVCSIDPLISWQGSYLRKDGLSSLLTFLVCFLAWTQVLRTQAAVRRALTTIVLCLLPVCAYATMQKFGVDPLWGSMSVSKIGSTCGNAVSLGAFLVTALPFLIYRCADLLGRWGTVGRWQRLSSLAHVALLAWVGAVMIWTSARGPTVGLFVALLFAGWVTLRTQPVPPLGLLDALKALALVIGGLLAAIFGLWGAVRLLGVNEPAASFSATICALTLLASSLGVALLSRRGPSWLRLSLLWLVGLILIGGALLNIPPDQARNIVPRPIADLCDRWRTIPWVWRFARVLDPDRSTGKVRVLLWTSGVQQLTQGVRVAYPDGASDGLAPVRWLIGWGQDTEELTFPQFYPTELAYMEGQQRVDRLHNHTLDTLVTTGAVGLAAWHLVYLVAILVALRQLGFRVGWRNVAGCAVAAAGAAGALLALKSAHFIGVAVPFAALLGLALTVPSRATGAPGPNPRLALACLVAIVAHFLELQVGFALVASSLMTFFALAMLQAIQGHQAEGEEGGSWFEVPLMSCILTTMAFELFSPLVFLTRVASKADVPSVWRLWSHLGWTNDPARRLDDPAGIIFLVFLWLGLWTLAAAAHNRGDWRSWLGTLAAAPLVAGLSTLVAAIPLRMAYFWVWLIPGTDKITLDDAVGMLYSGFQGFLLTMGATWLLHYLWLILVLPGCPSKAGDSQGSDLPTKLGIAFVAAISVLLVWFSAFKPPLADALYAQAQNIQRTQAEDAEDAIGWRLPVATMETVVALAPRVDQYQSYLGDFQGRQAFLEKEPADRLHLRRRARDSMLKARDLAPLEPNNANNVALSCLKLFRELPPGDPSGAQLLGEARQEYTRGVGMNPYDMDLRIEFGNRLLEEYHDLDGAYAMYRQALQLDPRYYKAFYGLAAVYENRARALPLEAPDRQRFMACAATAALIGTRFEPPGADRESRRRVMLELHRQAGLPQPADVPVAQP